MKLGEALIRAGLITQEQLDLALERQVVYGGRIDTNIVELRYLTDEQLTRFLGKFLRLPFVTPDMIDSIDPDVLKIVKKDMAEKYRVLPFKAERQRLHIAMLNPRSVRDVTELQFITGLEIIPYVATELRLLRALEKYYGIQQRLRYISLKDSFASESNEAAMRIERASEGKRPAADVRGTTAGPGADASHAASGIEEISLDEIGVTPTEFTYAKEMAGLIASFLTQATYTARLLHAQQGSSLAPAEIEEEVFRQWERMLLSILDVRKGGK